MTILFTADTHFGDPRALRFDHRPFGDLAAHDEALIARWNAAVGPGDTVWHLGDVALGPPPKRLTEILDALNGEKHLVVGNNDDAATLAMPHWASVGTYREIAVDGRALVLCHYAFRTWNGIGRGALNLHGHSHGKLLPMTKQYDVGVDAQGFKPVTLAEILASRRRRGAARAADLILDSSVARPARFCHIRRVIEDEELMRSRDQSKAAATSRASDEMEMFELAPVSLWLEDYSGIRDLFRGWRASGVDDLRAFLDEDPARVATCSAQIRVLKVNRKTLDLFEARDFDHLVANLDRVFKGDMLTAHVDELVQLWEGATRFASLTANYALSGRRLDVQVRGVVLPGHETSLDRVMVSLEDVTERETARRDLAESGDYARGLFQHSPVSLWVEDFSAIKDLLDGVRERGITDFRTFTDVHPEFVERCISEIRVIDVNRHTLTLFEAPDVSILLARLDEIFRADMIPHFREQLLDLWNGKLFQSREVVNYALSGHPLHVHLQFSVFPGHETDWSLVQVALTDITARKKAEAYLEFLGKHDVLTKLHNRTFYAEELNRLERKGPHPVSVAIIDVDGLKAANDQWGHAAGDELLRRAGEVLAGVVTKSACAARTGGDEFAVLMPGGGEEAIGQIVEEIQTLVAVNNQFYTGSALSLSIGTATSRPGEKLEETVKRADAHMYEAKRRYYERVGRDRRGAPPLDPA